jgi:nicotinamidase/pyrazinamidase
VIPADTDILVIVDVQNDFCSGGALAVPGGEEVVPLANDLAQLFANVALTQDWHPAGHSSFASSHRGRAPFETIEADYGPQTLWPDHCVQGSQGAAFHRDLDTDRAQLVIRKGFRAAIDSYSALFENDHATETGLNGYLADRGMKRVFLCGLATDFCVGFSAIDAAACGYATFVIEDACRAIDLDGSLAASKAQMAQVGVTFLASRDIAR